MRFVLVTLLTLLLAPEMAASDRSVSAQVQAAVGERPTIVDPMNHFVFPIFVEGLNAQSVFRLVNLNNSEARFRLFFQRYTGESLEVPVAGVGSTSSVRGRISPRGMVTVSTTGMSSDLKIGYAILFNDTDPALGLEVGATLTVRSNKGEPGEATAVVSEAFQPRSVMPFDTSSSALTLIACSEPRPQQGRSG